MDLSSIITIIIFIVAAICNNNIQDCEDYSQNNPYCTDS